MTNIADTAQKIAFAGDTNNDTRPLFPDALARLLASGNDCYLDLTRARQGSRLVELLLAQTARQKDEHPLRRDALRGQPHP